MEMLELQSNILYELLIYAEWQQDPEIQGKSLCDHNCGVEGYVSKLLGPFAAEQNPPSVVCQLNNLQMPWALAIGGSGAVIAILQDSYLEIRTSRDEYGAIIGKTQVNKDPHPQWRRILWSPDCTMLVYADSSGKLDFYDLIGAHMFTINEVMQPSSKDGKHDFRYSIAGMAFSDVRVKNTQWSYEFLVANYLGDIHGFFLSPSGGFKRSHTFSLASCYPDGITCWTYVPVDDILVVCGRSRKLSRICGGPAQMGLSVWRLLSDAPHYKLALSVDEQLAYSKCNWKTTLYEYFNLYKYTLKGKNTLTNEMKRTEDVVIKMCISPNRKLIVAVHIHGSVSVWDLPSLRLRHYWPLELQPNASDANPHHSEPGMNKRSGFSTSDLFHSHVVDINWWSDDALIVVRQCGAVTVSSIRSLQNLLGVSPEWFEPSPAVSSFCDRGFLALESEVRVKAKRSVDDLSDDEEDSGDEEEPSIFKYSYDLAKSALYFVTDSDRFQPPRKKMKMITKTYRLLCVKSTTPEELYTRKISNEEYGEALALAKSYDLDSDLVYQRQWRKMPATVESIHDYLSKIKKRSWVLHECMERVPESLEAARELLHYGLRGTDVAALLLIGKGEDRGRFIVSNDSDYLEDDSFQTDSDAEEAFEAKKMRAQKKRVSMLKQVNFKKLTLEQKQLCQYRLKLLNYLDRLATYEVILGGPLSAEQHYDPAFFREFRAQSGFEAAVGFARGGHWEAVAALFTYLGAETLPHRLAALAHFPETTPPLEYQSLLPLFNERQLVFYPWDEHALRDLDWCEQKFSRIPQTEEFAQEFYGKYKDMEKYRQVQLSFPLVTEWFIQRSKEIESLSGLVENAIQLLKLGIQRNIEGLEKHYDDMTTLELLTYECKVKSDLSFDEYQAMSGIERVNLMMSTTTKDNFLKNFQQWLLPFLNRCSMYESNSGVFLFKSYILLVSKRDLFYCKKILESLKPEQPFIIPDINEITSLALDCVYHCERSEELKNARSIYELLLSLIDSFHRSSRKIYSLPTTVTLLKKHISTAELLDKNGLSVVCPDVRNISNSSEDIKKLFTKLTRMASHRIPALTDDQWTALLSDILEMQKVLFQAVSPEDCYEIVLQSLLCSGQADKIAFAGGMLECGGRQERGAAFRLPFTRSVALVLAASREYFNAAADAADPCMGLARNCLNLIEDAPASIEEEYDLISSISLLQEFNVNILPLQVRLSQDRMCLVQEALKRKDRGYKKSFKVMTLANLLRAGSSDSHEREGKVLTLIAEYAFQAKDYNECLLTCKKLMEKCHQDGWGICYTLGGCNEFGDFSARSTLMSFALAYCSEDLIETILERKAELQLQVLQEQVRFLMGDASIIFSKDSAESKSNDGKNTDKDAGSVLWQTTERTVQALQTTTKTAKDVLTSVKSVQFWKDAIHWVQPLSLGWEQKALDIDNPNNNLMRQGVCAFYDGLVEKSYINQVEANYQRYARPDLNRALEISSSILRASLIQDSLRHETEISTVERRVLMDVAKSYLPDDFLYSLCVLLALTEVRKAESLFAELPSSPIVLQLACLYYSIKIRMKFGISFTQDSFLDSDPSTFCKNTLDLTNSSEPGDDECFDLLRRYDQRLYDFVQAEILHSIGGGVDATRFANDDVYKRDTILGIAMTVEDTIFQTALSLAHHYNIPVWDLYMTHLEYLFSESKISPTLIAERLEKFAISEKLLHRKRAFERRLRDFVFPIIDGKDHEKLQICLSLLESCGDNEDVYKISPSVHKKLLSKFKATTKNLDYKKIMDPEASLSYFSEILNESNVHLFAKTASSIPKKGCQFYESSNIYCLWTEKYFFEGSSTKAKVPVTKTEWIHRFESCKDMLERLETHDVLEFVDSVIFSKKALEKMSVDCRSDVLKRIIKLCRAKSSRHKANILLSTQWSDAASSLLPFQMHLQRLEDEAFVQLRDDPKAREYCVEFELSKSLPDKLKCLLTRIVLEGPDLELLKTFVSCCPPDIDLEPSDSYMHAIDAILQQMKNTGVVSFSCFQTVTPVQVLENILLDITKLQEELMVIEDLAAERLNAFCQESDVSVTTRLAILQLLEKTNCISAEYSDLLLLYRTQAVVSSVWPDLQVSEDEVKDELERRTLFDSMLVLCKREDEFAALVKLLGQWPPFRDLGDSSPSEEPWTQLICGLASLSSHDSLSSALSAFRRAMDTAELRLENCEEIFQAIKEQGFLLYTLKCALMTSYSTLHSTAMNLLRSTPKVSAGDYDRELLDLVLRRRLTAWTVGTGLYGPVIEFLLHCQDDSEQDSPYRTVDSVVTELNEAGHLAEAGSLLLVRDSTHPGLSTFSAATCALERWRARADKRL